MKHLKKLAGVLLALVMVMALAVPAFAADPDPDQTPEPTIDVSTPGASITIDIGDPDGTNTATYTYYEMLHASIGADGKSVSYFVNNNTQEAALKAALEGLALADSTKLFTLTLSADGTRWNVELNAKTATGEEIAELLNEIKANAIATGTFKSTGSGNPTATGLDRGYYLITSTLGSKLVLDTLGHETIHTKNEYITTDKTASRTNMNVGDTVTYEITVKIPATANVGGTVTVHDTLNTAYLAILDKDDEIASSADKYYITATCDNVPVDLDVGVLKEGETFAKSFTITKEMLGKAVVLTYKAELLSTAANEIGYVNTAYANTPDYETAPDDHKVWTFDFDLDKNFAGVDGDETKVARFELADANGDKIYFIRDDTGYVVADSTQTSGRTTTLEVNGRDNINIRGLAAGKYTLTEIETADGYNLLKEPVIVTIEDTTEKGDAKPSHKVSYKIGEDGTVALGTVTVVNNSGSELPSTGGIGTTLFYVVGGVLVLGAVVLLITKRRTSVDDE